MIDISFQARLQRIQHLHAVRPGRDAHLVPVMAAVWPDLRPRKPGALADLLAWGLLVWVVAFAVKLHLMLGLTGTAYREAVRDLGRHDFAGAALGWLLEPGPVSLALAELLRQAGL